MKKSILALGLLLISTGFMPVYGQDETTVLKEEKKQLTPEERAKKKTDRMVKDLNLSEEQGKELYDINLKHAVEREALKKEREALKAKHKKAKEQHIESLKQVLSKEQMAQLENLKKERRERAKCKHDHSIPPPPPPAPAKP